MVRIFRDMMWHSVPKFKECFYINIKYKRSLYFGIEGYSFVPRDFVRYLVYVNYAMGWGCGLADCKSHACGSLWSSACLEGSGLGGIGVPGGGRPPRWTSSGLTWLVTTKLDCVRSNLAKGRFLRKKK